MNKKKKKKKKKKKNVFVYHSDLFDFYVFAMIHRLSREPLCEPNVYVFLY